MLFKVIYLSIRSGYGRKCSFSSEGDSHVFVEIFSVLIDHFTVVGLVTWPLNGSEAGVDLVLIQTSLLLLCKSSCSYAN